MRLRPGPLIRGGKGKGKEGARKGEEVKGEEGKGKIPKQKVWLVPYLSVCIFPNKLVKHVYQFDIANTKLFYRRSLNSMSVI